MIRTEKMVQLSAVVLEKYQDQVIKELVDLGQLDFISVKELSPGVAHSLSNVKQEVSLSKIKDLRRKLESIMLSSSIDFPEVPDVDKSFSLVQDFERVSEAVTRINDQISGLRSKQRVVQSDLLRLEEMQRQVDGAFRAKQRVKNSAENIYANHLVVRVGQCKGKSNKEELLTKLRDFSCSLIETETIASDEFYLVHLKGDILKLDAILSKAQWENDQVLMGDIGITESLIAQFDLKMKEIREAQHELQFSLEDQIVQNSEEIKNLWKSLRIAETYQAIQQQFNKTDKTLVFSGWIMEKMKKKVSDSILSICGDDCYLEFTDAVSVKEALGIEAPVMLQTPRLLKPFEKVITDFSIPAYGTLNPAIIVSITFLVMFGMMFGDVGHGAVIALGSLAGILRAKKKKKPVNSMFNLMLYCGISAMFFGVLFGSYFGFTWFNGLLFNYHGAVVGHHTHGMVNSIMGVLLLTTWFGVGIISLGLLFNFYNCIAQRRWMALFTDKSGIAGALMYWCGVYLSYLFMKKEPFGTTAMVAGFLCFGVGLVLYMVRLVAHSIHEEGKFKASKIGMIIMEFFIEILELFSGYLANTLSFLRVAGLGIAHVSLMVAFEQLANMVGRDSVGSTIGYILILILGNVLVIGLEGLSAWIQTLRLHYYEFFSKFLVGGGIAYNPINLSNKRD